LVSRRQAAPPAGLAESGRLRLLLKGDLDRIIMTALRKRPNRRYATAAALSEDIERYFGGHPVRARGASTAYRLRKFVQRNQAASVALVAIIGTLTVALILVRGQALEAERQRDLAEQEAARALSAKEFLIELIGRSDPFENTESATLAGALRQSVDGMEARFDGQPALEAEMRYAIGYALQNLGEIPLAREQIERAQVLRDEVGAPVDRAEVFDALGIINWWESDFNSGEVNFAEALGLLAGDESERARVLKVNVYNNLAGLRADGGRFEASVEASDAALAASAGLEIGLETQASIWGNKANALGSIEGRGQEAIEAFEKAAELQKAATGEMHPNYAIILNNLGLTHYMMGNLEEMTVLFERSLEIRRETLGPEHPQTATALFNLAGGQVAAGQFEAAEPTVLEALRVAENGWEPGHPRIGKAHETLAKVYRALEQPKRARAHGNEALALYEAAPSVDPAWIASVQSILDSLPPAD
ncbi:MAG: tetratricopeptide repeat protein, partial [Pseudomonadota bacterium]